MTNTPFKTPDEYFFVEVTDGKRFPAHFKAKQQQVTSKPALYTQQFYEINPTQPFGLIILCYGDLTKDQLTRVKIHNKHFKVTRINRLYTNYADVSLELMT